MPDSFRRRHVLALWTGAVAAIAGCRSGPILDSNVPIGISVTNATDENHEILVQLRGASEEVDDQLGDSLISEADSIEFLRKGVPRESYTLRVILDSVEPTVETEVPWEISEENCSQNSTITIAERDESTELLVNVQSCQNT